MRANSRLGSPATPAGVLGVPLNIRLRMAAVKSAALTSRGSHHFRVTRASSGSRLPYNDAVTFRALLSVEFDRRRARNPRYSMRCFARSLRTHHSTLSRLLNGGRPIQARTIVSLGRSLGLSESAIRACIASEDAEAICRAVRRATFRPDSRWLAAMCGLSIDRVNIALHALIHGGRLRMVAADRWIVLDANGGKRDECTRSAVAVDHNRA